MRYLAVAVLCLHSAAYAQDDDLPSRHQAPTQASARAEGVAAPKAVVALGNEARRRHPDFLVPPAMRGRVAFWRDVFTKYSRNQVVIHHRQFPQATFGVIDFSAQVEQMKGAQLEKYKKQVTAQKIQELQDALKFLATGAAPETEFQKMVYERMKLVPGPESKYQRAITDDLIRTQTGIKEKFGDAVRRAGRYIPIMESVFKDEFGLPPELTRLPFVESSFDYKAYSAVGAAGIWQFMPKTGRLYMTVNKLIDERRDPLAATRGAARYLANAYSQIGNWPLALTSYNHGLAGVIRKMRKLGTSDISQIVENPEEQVFGFASNNFFAEFLAALEVYDNHRLYFPDVVLEPALKVVEIPLQRPVSLSYAARQIGIDTDSLLEVNYAFSSAIVSGRAKIPSGYVLKVPKQYATRAANLRIPEPHVQAVAPASSAVHGGLVYKVRAGDSLASIARRYNVTVARLKEINQLNGETVKVGQILRIDSEGKFTSPVDSGKAKSLEVDDSEKNSQQHVDGQKIQTPSKPEQSGTVGKESLIKKKSVSKDPAKKSQATHRTYLVRSGDSIWSISQKFGVSAESLKKLNHMRGNSLKAGQQLVVPR